MSERSADADMRSKVIGLGERSLRKSHYAALQRSLRELAEKDRQIRQAYSDVINAVTGGRLIILGRDELDEGLVVPECPTCELREASQLPEARATVRAALEGVPGAKEIILAFSEAATNMLKHADGGIYRFGRVGDRFQVMLSDTGPGIDFRQLPKATLEAGFSTTHTLGMGFTLMLELTDRLLLCTGPGGTTLILEKDLVPAGTREVELEPLGA